MNWVDAALLAVMVLSAMLAFLRGFVRETLGIAAWFGAAFAAFAFRGLVRPFTDQLVEQPWISDGIAVAAVFLVVLVVLKLAIHALAGRVQDSALGGLDRSLGAIFGLARGLVIAMLLYVLGGLAEPEVGQWPAPVREARTLPHVADGARRLVGLLPPEYRPRIAAPPARREPTQDDLLRPPARTRT